MQGVVLVLHQTLTACTLTSETLSFTMYGDWQGRPTSSAPDLCFTKTFEYTDRVQGRKKKIHHVFCHWKLAEKLKGPYVCLGA